MQLGTPQEARPSLILPTPRKQGACEYWDLVRKTVDYINAFTASPPPVPTTIPAMDEIMKGGFRPGVHFLGGTTGAGKTAFALYLASRIAQSDDPVHPGEKCGVTIISLELSASEVRARLGSRLSYRNDALTPYKWAEFEQRGFEARRAKEEAEGGWPMWDDPVYLADLALMEASPRIRIVDGARNPRNAKLPLIEQEIAFCGDAGGSLVIVDYLQCVDAGLDLDEQQSMKAVARALSIAGIRAGVPVLAISAVSRSKGTEMRKGERPAADVFRGSSWIEYTSLTAWALVRTDDAERCGDYTAVDLYPVKNRRGTCDGPIRLGYNGQYGHFSFAQPAEGGGVEVA